MTVEVVTRLQDVGPEWDGLFESGPGVQSRRMWFEVTEAAGLAEGWRPRYLLARDGSRPAAVLPMQTGPGRQMVSLTTPYSIRFQPLAAGSDLEAAGEALSHNLRRWPVVRIEALDQGWAGLPRLLAGLRRGGVVALPFDHFGSWHEDVSGFGWDAYLAARPGQLRETIRRRGKAVAKDDTIRFEVVGGTDGLAAAMAAYEAVYARSWKVPEPFPRFNATLLPRLAEAGMLRLGIIWQGTRALAAQYWTVCDGVATVLKLAHDDEAKALSPGTMLTAHMIQRLLDEERVRVLDFGRGDDPYKRLWSGTRQQRIGLLLVNPWRLRGMLAFARHELGKLARRAGARAPSS